MIIDSIDNDCDGNIDSGMGGVPAQQRTVQIVTSIAYEGHNFLFCTSESAQDFAKGGCISNPNYHLVTIKQSPAENDWLIWNIIDSIFL